MNIFDLRFMFKRSSNINGLTLFAKLNVIILEQNGFKIIFNVIFIESLEFHSIHTHPNHFSVLRCLPHCSSP